MVNVVIALFLWLLWPGGVHRLHCPPFVGDLGRLGAPWRPGHSGHTGGQQGVVPEHDPTQPWAPQSWGAPWWGGAGRRSHGSGRFCPFRRRWWGQVPVWTHSRGGGGGWGRRRVWPGEPPRGGITVGWRAASGLILPLSVSRPQQQQQVPPSLASPAPDAESCCHVCADPPPPQDADLSGAGGSRQGQRTEPGGWRGGLPAYGNVTNSTTCPALRDTSAGCRDTEAGPLPIMSVKSPRSLYTGDTVSREQRDVPPSVFYFSARRIV